MSNVQDRALQAMQADMTEQNLRPQSFTEVWHQLPRLWSPIRPAESPAGMTNLLALLHYVHTIAVPRSFFTACSK